MLRGEGIPLRLASCLLFAIIVMLFAALPTSSLSVRPESAWSAEKLHTVVIGTIFTIGFVVALVSQFFLVKPGPRTDSDALTASSALRVH
jgi:hypothetical protein